MELQRDERLDMTQIPSQKHQFDIYVNQHLLKKDLSVPYLLNEYIEGQEYAANVVCKNGNIYLLQVSKTLKSVMILNRVLFHSATSKIKIVDN